MNTLILNKSINSYQGVGLKRAAILKDLGILTTGDILLFSPAKYVTNDEVCYIEDMPTEQYVLVEVKVDQPGRIAFLKGKKTIISLAVSDESAQANAVWFNQPYVRLRYKTGMRIWLRARKEVQAGKITLHVRESGIGNAPATGLQAVYSLSKKISQKQFRIFVNQALIQVEEAANVDFWPSQIAEYFNLIPLAKAFRYLHCPADLQQLELAKRRLAFDEIAYQLSLRQEIDLSKTGISQVGNQVILENWLKGLPYSLTVSQQECIAKIKEDQISLKPMRRLLQGDVGSGKTVVAAAAALTTITAGKQVAFLAPTELLARQHYANLQEILRDYADIELILGSFTAKQKRELNSKAKLEKPSIWLGTHALLSEGFGLPGLGLIIIDEQHRFGVKQRKKLVEGRKIIPDLLCLSATPIPRSLALIMYGDLDSSLLQERPGHRQGITTTWLKRKNHLERFWTFANKEIEAGHKVFWVCPSIEQDMELGLSSLEEREPMLRSIWPHARLKTLHGKLKEDIKQDTMQDLLQGNSDVLLGTTVIEVGIDQPLATIIVIENAERFGLAQLHQLRGRVGRGKFASHCILITGKVETLIDEQAIAITEVAKKRLEALCTSEDGFALAQLDLELRGPGEVFGVIQSGFSEGFVMQKQLKDEELEYLSNYLKKLNSYSLDLLRERLAYINQR